MEEAALLTPEQIQVLTAAAADVVAGGVGGAGEGQPVQLAYLTEDGMQLHHVAVSHEDQQVVIQQKQQPQHQVVVLQEQEGQHVVQQQDHQHHVEVEVQSPLVQVQEGQQVDLQVLLQAGAISAEDYAALSGSPVTVPQVHQPAAGGEETLVLQQNQQEQESEQVQLIKDSEGNLLQVVVQNDENNPGTVLQEHQEEEDEDYLVQCGKCGRTFRPRDFDCHFEEVHRETPADSAGAAAGGRGGTRGCSVCGRQVPKRDYLAHFKSTHADVRLGCPKCPQTYHSPELLNVHYKHFHLKEEEAEGAVNLLAVAAATEAEEAGGPLSDNHHHQQQHYYESEVLLQKCRLCGAKCPDLRRHLVEEHPGEKAASSSSRRTKKPGIDCKVCLKSFDTQRDFTNHRRRKGFCKPPAKAPPPQTRRIGIIRKSL